VRVWTVEEANAALPRVRATVERLRAALTAARERAELLASRISGNGHVPPNTEALWVRGSMKALSAQGIVMRDLETGLVDFSARSASGREYWLCWRFGEPEVGYWHWPEDGFAGRRPLSEAPEADPPT
jgi:hypothetical protein